MKLIIKNLKQVIYNVDVADDTVTIENLKKEIEKVHGFDSTSMKLLCNGVILENAKTLADYKIKEENVIILMNCKAKPKNVPTEPPKENQPQQNVQNPPANPNQNISIAQPISQSNPQSNPQTQSIPAPQKDYSAQIDSLVDMGFNRAQADEAIKAARGNIELAVEFLYNGIPENIPNFDDPMGGMGGVPGNTENVSELQKAASIIKVLCSSNPNLLPSILQNIQQTEPGLMQTIKDNEEQFKELITKPITQNDLAIFSQYRTEIGDEEGGGMDMGGQGGQGGFGSGMQGHPHGQNVISLTKEENDAINRLISLGNFDKSDVVQTYFACDKNEELAANMLFEQKMNEDMGAQGQFGFQMPPQNPPQGQNQNPPQGQNQNPPQGQNQNPPQGQNQNPPQGQNPPQNQPQNPPS